MSIDFETLLFAKEYEVWGDDAVLILPAGGTFALRVIDGVKGAEVEAKSGRGHIMSSVQLFTVQPVAYVRAAELTTKAISVKALEGASITFNGSTWIVKDAARDPGTQGPNSGDIKLILGASS